MKETWKKWLAWSAVAALITRAKPNAGRVKEEVWFETEPKRIPLDQVLVNSAGSCTFYQDQVCSTFGEVEKDTFGFFRRHPNQTEEILQYVLRFQSDEIFSFRNTMENGRFLVPVYLRDNLWLLRTVKDGESVERFHIFSTNLKRLLNRGESNLDELDGHESWRSIARADPAYYYLATDTGAFLEYDESPVGSDLIRFSQIADTKESFGVNKFDWPLALDRMTGKLRVGVIAGKVYYSLKLQLDSWEPAAILPFTQGIGTCIGVRIVRCRTESIECGYVSANFRSPQGDLFTRYISYRGLLLKETISGSSPISWKFSFVSFEDRVGVVYPEYAHAKEVVFRAIPTEPSSSGAMYFKAIMMQERTYMKIRSFDLALKVQLSSPQVQALRLTHSELDSRGIHNVQCSQGECLGALIGVFGRVNVFYTNQRNFNFKWVKVAQASAPGSLVGIQVSHENSGSWIVMVVTDDHLRFARVNPVQFTGMEWFEPFDLPTIYQACGLYAGALGAKSYVACAMSSEERGDTIGSVFSFEFSETAYEALRTDSFRFGGRVDSGIPLKTLRIEWGKEDTFVLVTSRSSTLFVSNKPVHTFYRKHFAFSPSGNAVFYFQTYLSAYLYGRALGIYLLEVFWGWNSWNWDLNIDCKVSSLSSTSVLFVCAYQEHIGSLLFDWSELTYRGIDYTPRSYDKCSVLAPSDGVLVEFCIDASAMNFTSSVFKGDLDQLNSIAVGADAEELPVDTFGTDNWRLATILLGSVLGLVLVVGVAAIRKKEKVLNETFCESHQVSDDHLDYEENEQLPLEATEVRRDAGSDDDDVLYATPAH